MPVNVEGRLEFNTGKGGHRVEYEPASMTGGGTAFFSLNLKCTPSIPIHVSNIDDVCDMLLKMKSVIQAAEGG